MDWEGFQRATLLWQSGRNDEALREFEELYAGANDHEEKSSLLLNQARCLLDSGRVKEARERWSAAIAYWDNLYVQLFDAALSEAEGEQAEVTRKLSLLLERNRSYLKQSGEEETYFNVCRKLGYLLFEAERYADAIQPLNEAAGLAQTAECKRELCRYLGFCYLEILNLDAAEQKFIESVPSSPDDPWWAKAQFNLGRVYFQRGAYAKAKDAFERSQFFGHEDPELKHGVTVWLARIATYLPSNQGMKAIN